MNLIGKFLNYDPSTSRLTIEIGFANIQQLEYIEDQIQNGKFFEISFKTRHKISKTYEQQKLYYVSISKIIEAEKKRCGILNTNPTREEISDYDEMLRRDFFPVKKGFDIAGENEILRIVSIHDLSFEELSGIIRSIQDRYSYLNIVWEKVEK